MTKPSWQDFGTHDESAFPELWAGVAGAWAPCLGPTGSRLHDHSRRANWGTLTNMDSATDWVVSDGQYALDFDGVNDFVATSLQMPTAANRAFLCRFRYSATLSLNQFDIALSGGAQSQGAGVYVGFGNNAQWGSTGFGCSQYGDGFGVTGFNDGKWHVGLCQHVGNNWSIWVDGIERATKTMTTVPTAGAVVLGTSISNQNYAGEVAEFAIWQRALSTGEIMRLYQIGCGGMYQRRRRSRVYIAQAGFQAAWARRQNQIIGGGLR